MKPEYLIRTLGCKANAYDSELIEGELRKKGWSPAENGASENVRLCIVNTCTVTDEADRQSRKTASKLAREYPKSKIVVTGCAAEVDPERLAQSKGIHYVIGNRDKNRLVELVLENIGGELESVPSDVGEVLGVAQSYEEIKSQHPLDRIWPLPELKTGVEGTNHKTRAFLKIQEGCNSFCTYCIIPYGRGPSRSLKIEEVCEEIRNLIHENYQEVVLTGINLGDFGSDWGAGEGLIELVRAILSQTDLKRLRLSSLDPVEISPELMLLMSQEPRLCPHFHVSLQSPQSRILRLMKRKYRYEDVEKCLKQISEIPSPVGGVFVGMDLITGFPGETEEEFDRTLSVLESLPWSRLHVFPYSERKGTPATRLPESVLPKDRTLRCRKLRELSLKRLISHYQRALDTEATLEVLLEGAVKNPETGKRCFSGYTANYLRVLLSETEELQGLRNSLVKVVPESLVIDENAGDVAVQCRVAS